MLPVTHGVQFTKLQIILYTIILILVSLLPFVVMMSGILYFISALILGVIFLYYAVRLYFEEDSASAFPTFVYSIYYIFLIFAALLIDHFII
jgi:protoheme IX farnesyltransferase